MPSKASLSQACLLTLLALLQDAPGILPASVGHTLRPVRAPSLRLRGGAGCGALVSRGLYGKALKLGEKPQASGRRRSDVRGLARSFRCPQ
jgi:hypothetical protein